MSEIREKILAAKEEPLDLKPEEVPEWGVTVHFRGWTAKERDRFENEFTDAGGVKDYENISARVLVRFMFDESGARVFKDEDADALGEKYGLVVSRLWDRMMTVAGTRRGTLEGAKKN